MRTGETGGLPGDLALLINLPSATDRLAFQERQLREMAIPFRLLPATAVADVPAARMEQLRASWARPLRATEVCCTLSHRRAWEEVVASGRPRVVLEDDAILSLGAAGLLAALLARDDLDYVQLETYALPKLLSRESAPVGGTPFRLSRLVRDKGGSAAYLIWPRAAAMLLESTKDRTPLADAAIDMVQGFRHHQVEPAMAVQAMFLARSEPPFAAVGPSLIAATPVPDYPGWPAWLRHKSRRLAMSLQLLWRRLRAPDAERRRVDHPPDLYDPLRDPQTRGHGASP